MGFKKINFDNDQKYKADFLFMYTFEKLVNAVYDSKCKGV